MENRFTVGTLRVFKEKRSPSGPGHVRVEAQASEGPHLAMGGGVIAPATPLYSSTIISSEILHAKQKQL